MKEDKLAGGSMARLAESYSERFGEALPLEQYMTLYDTWDSRRPGKPSGASTEAAEPRRPVPTQHTEGWCFSVFDVYRVENGLWLIYGTWKMFN